MNREESVAEEEGGNINEYKGRDDEETRPFGLAGG